MIKKVMMSVMSLALAATVSFTPSRSKAMIVIEPVNAVFLIVPAGVFLCVLFLPFCILDEKAQVSRVTEQDLLNNGYTQDQVKNIEVGQTAVLNYMGTHNMKSATQYSEAINALRDQLNSDYLDFVATAP